MNMTDERFKQCKFKKGDTYTIAYIPEHAAKVGNRVELLTLDGDFWEVISVSEQSVSKQAVKDNERNYKAFQASTRGGGIDA